MKNHLKRIAAPKSWVLNRKDNTFVVRPNPGSHPLERGLPLGVILRDFLNQASTMAEVRKILNNHKILVDGRRRNDPRFIVGLFDVISISDLNKFYRLILDKHGRIIIKEITEEESQLKPCKIIGKMALTGGKIQLNLYDGKNILTDRKTNVGDTVLLQLPQFTVKEILPLQKGAAVFLTIGKHSGSSGLLKEIKGKEVIYTVDGQDTETAKEHLFVIGKKEPAITIK